MELITIMKCDIDHIENKPDVQLVVMKRQDYLQKRKIWIVTDIKYTEHTAILTLAIKAGQS